MPFAAAITGLFVSEEQADTIPALQEENSGSEKQRNESLANHTPNLRGHPPDASNGGFPNAGFRERRAAAMKAIELVLTRLGPQGFQFT